MSEKNCSCQNPRMGKVGGEAVIEGVMMRSGEKVSVASRMPNKSIKITNKTFVSLRKKHKWLNVPILRGIVNFVEMMILSYKILGISADVALTEDEKEAEMSKFDKWLDKHFGDKILNIIMGFSVIIGLALSIFLFMFLPTYTTGGLSYLSDKLFNNNAIFESVYFKSIIEGIMKVVIFVAYIALVSLMKDIKRTFEYHGAEHKSIFCYEKGLELTVENVKMQKRFHPRCGTSFIFVMIILGILIGLFIPWGNKIVRVAIKLLLLPLTVGIGYEFILYAGKHDNKLTRILSAPGLWMQRLTTKEPKADQIECAIAALKCAMPDEFPGAYEEIVEKYKPKSDTNENENDDTTAEK